MDPELTPEEARSTPIVLRGRRRRVRTVGPRVSVGERFREILRYRELLGNLVRKELKVKYKNSALGFLWSMMNPAMYLVVFYLVFTVFLRAGIPNFAVFLLSGLLAWNLFSTGLAAATGSIVGNANLVSKVYFPREVLPLSAIGASLVHFFLQMLVLVAALVVFRYPVDVKALFLIPFALVAVLILGTAFALLLSAWNVYLRDIQHLLEVLLLAWFWMTPIIYPVSFVFDSIGAARPFGIPVMSLYWLNPMTSIVLAFQRGLYGVTSVTGPDGVAHPILVEAPLTWYLGRVGLVTAGALALLAFSWWVFRRLESNLAEEL